MMQQRLRSGEQIGERTGHPHSTHRRQQSKKPSGEMLATFGTEKRRSEQQEQRSRGRHI
jgi:hypothetical protein